MSDLVRLIGGQLAMLRAKRVNPVLWIRMHPMDILALQRAYGIDTQPEQWQGGLLFGVPVEGDEALPRGEPVAEYAEG
jgi:hypothetical protein